MAKKATPPGDPLFVPDFRRRHPHLILPKLLSEVVTPYHFDDARLMSGLAALNQWADLAAKGALNQKETSLDAEFLRVIFGQALGYKTRTDSPDDYGMERQFPVPGAGTADGALGFFAVGTEHPPIAVIECKDAETDLDHDKFNGRTAVQQLWDYLAQLPATPWGILSNYLTIRLYHRDNPMRTYQEFTVADFKEEKKAREFLYLFEPEGLLGRPPVRTARGLDLLVGSRERRIQVGDSLYTYYSEQRLHLIDALTSEYNYTNDDAIHAAQLLLDRIIFIAFCEDRGLLPAKLLENTWNNVAPLARASNPRWRNFLDTFHAIDKGHKALGLPTGYNGGLFRRDPLVDDLDLEDEPWTNVFKQIGDYDFRDEGEISVDVLGHLFEKSITELEKLRVLALFGRQASPAAGAAMPKSALRKRFGIYYTPPQFTQFIVDSTIGQLIADRVAPLEDIAARVVALRKLKVVDPACGSGAFLIAAYEVLESAYEVILHRLRVEGRSDDAAEMEREYPDWILADNLFGVDLSKEAVEITQLALWIRSARKGKTLADLSRNIVCGNSLVADPAAGERAMDWRRTFPAVFAAGGFDCVLGNPPWERLKLQEREFFSFSAPEIATAVSAAQRRRLIETLRDRDTDLYARYEAAKSAAEKTLAHIRASGRFPHTGRGDVNTYTLFAELSRQVIAPDGLIGLLVPSGIATDDTTRHFFADLMETKSLRALYDFENKEGIFHDVHRSFKFSVLLMSGRERQTDAADFVFFARSMDDLKPRSRHITLSARDLKLLNPNTRTCPIFRSRRDCELTKRIYRNVPILIDEGRKKGGNPWELKFVRMFDQTNDAEFFRDAKWLQGEGFRMQGSRWIRRKEVYLPVYEAKMMEQYDHRFAGVFVRETNWNNQGQTILTTQVEHRNPEHLAQPRWWLDAKVVGERLSPLPPAILAFRDVSNPTNQRTMLASFCPPVAFVNTLVLARPGAPITLRRSCCLLANFNAIPFDYVVRQKMGGLHLNFFIVEQLPTFPPDRYEEKCPWDKKTTLEKWISERVLKLTCTANDMRPLAEAAGFKEGVHRWDEAERARLRAELDAAYFHLYGLDREEVGYVLTQFQGAAKEDKAHGGVGPTRKAILDAFDSMRGE